MEKNLLEKQNLFLSTFKGLQQAMPALEVEQLIKMTFAYVFRDEEEETPLEPHISPSERVLDQRVVALREYRLRVGTGQEKASKLLGKVPSYISRLEAGIIKRLDKAMEHKILNLYKKLEEEKQT